MPPRKRRGSADVVPAAKRRQGKAPRLVRKDAVPFSMVDDRIKEILVSQHIPTSRVEVVGKDEIIIHNH